MKHAEEQERSDREYEEVLQQWEADGFIGPDWDISWDDGEGAHVIEFRVGKKVYAFSEAAMDYYIIGAVDWADHCVKKVRK